MNFITLYFSVFLICFANAQSSSKLFILISNVDGNLEIVKDPLIRFSWTLDTASDAAQNLTQSAYQILVASTEEILKSGTPDLWDSKKVISDRTKQIKYEGESLQPGCTLYWAVRAWDQNDQPTAYLYSHWAQGHMTEWSAKWIGAPKHLQREALNGLEDIDKEVVRSLPGLKPVLLFRKTFALDGVVKRAIIHCTTKGLFIG